MSGSIILINGASSAGKSTLAREVQAQADVPLLHFTFDLFIDGNILPREQLRSGRFQWHTIRSTVFHGYRRCLHALASSGNALVVDHIVETQDEMLELLDLFADLDVFFVGLHCSLAELERREKARGDRQGGDARHDLQTVHTFGEYDLELHSDRATVAENATMLLNAWYKRQHSSAFKRMSATAKAEKSA